MGVAAGGSKARPYTVFQEYSYALWCCLRTHLPGGHPPGGGSIVGLFISGSRASRLACRNTDGTGTTRRRNNAEAEHGSCSRNKNLVPLLAVPVPRPHCSRSTRPRCRSPPFPFHAVPPLPSHVVSPFPFPFPFPAVPVPRRSRSARIPVPGTTTPFRFRVVPSPRCSRSVCVPTS